MILLSDADLVLPDRVLTGGTVAIDGDRIAAVDREPRAAGRDDTRFDLREHYVLPGFIDVHVHGVEGTDALDGGAAIRTMAERLPRFGVTAFCPTSIACAPAALVEMLSSVRSARTSATRGARVLPAHLESNFISAEFKGAQPLECIRAPRRGAGPIPAAADFSADDVLREIENARPDVGIVTVAPEVDGGLDLIRDLVSHGHHVSLGHSGATYEQAMAGFDAGARQVTHLFNRMPPLGHRAPGLAGAALEHEDVIAEIICDGVHVHPAIVRMALSAKQPSGVMAITDGTAGSGLPEGTRTRLGGRSITVRDTARLDDGTIAGSVLTMDQAFVKLVTRMGVSIVDAATVCSTTPARAIGLRGFGAIVPGAIADLVVLGRDFRVVHTFVAGAPVYTKS